MASRSNDDARREAALELSRLPVLEYVREKSRGKFGAAVTLLNVVVLVVLFVAWLHSCSTFHAVLPSDSGPSSDLDYVPPALAKLEGEAGVTITERTLIYYSDTDTFNRTFNGVISNFWQPVSYTCGCTSDSECTFRSCGGTLPINVTYEQCTPWQEALALATGVMVYFNLGITLLIAVPILFCFPGIRKRGVDGRAVELNRWHYAKICGGAVWESIV
ncbi:unnamed protein product [Ectocarpus sp. CCAP 1310/34]|nr:unnamed protein product [Ectocarpus sp. CCAP 1310/34]